MALSTRPAMRQELRAPDIEHAQDAAPRDRRSTRAGVTLLVGHGAAYLVTLAGAVAPIAAPFNIACAIANGVLIALLFILGHDAAHGALVRGAKANRWLARFAFVPCVHAASLWRAIHNHGHHARTNLKGIDNVWAPMSKAQYDAASAPRRWLERVYRGPFGPAVYYYGEYWIHRVLLPLAPEVRKDWKRHWPDSLFAVTGFAATLTVIALAGHIATPARPLWQVLAVGWAIPFAVWNYLMGFTIYLNHTHPQIMWFDDEAKWRRFKGNVVDTAYVRMPNIIPLYTKVMAHTAHHEQTTMPVYALLDAQAELAATGVPLIAYTLTPGAYLRITRACKLFDFERMCWTDFDGVPS